MPCSEHIPALERGDVHSAEGILHGWYLDNFSQPSPCLRAGDAGAILPCSGQTLQRGTPLNTPGMDCKDFLWRITFPSAAQFTLGLYIKRVWNLKPESRHFQELLCNRIGMTTDRYTTKKRIDIFVWNMEQPEYNYCNTNIRSTPDYDNFCITETSNMSGKQHSAQQPAQKKDQEHDKSNVWSTGKGKRSYIKNCQQTGGWTSYETNITFEE